MVSNQTMGQKQSQEMIKLNKQVYLFENLIREIKEQTSYNFTYSNNNKLKNGKVTIKKNTYRLQALIEEIAKQLNLKYRIVNKQISFKMMPAKKVTLSGYIRDYSTGEDLIGATCFINEQGAGTTANAYGFYSLDLTPGKHQITYSFIGYKPQIIEVDITSDKMLNIKLNTKDQQLSEVIVKGDDPVKKIKRPEMSTVKIQANTVKKLPALMGEVDVLKTIQMLPGVKSAAEGSTGFSVRGGNPDQNLLILDEAPVYNASHLLGFFSIFNNDALSDIKLYKGDIPASFGGRLSSLLDIRMKNGNTKKVTGNGGIGTVSSRLTLEGPIGNKENTSFIISGRRSYADLFLRLSSDEDIKDNIVYFYDLNTKVNHRFNDKNRLFISSYLGKDQFKNDDSGLSFGNQTFTARWNHLFSNKLFSNTTLLYSKYNYELSNKDGAEAFIWDSELINWSLKLDYTYYLNPSNTIKFGGSTSYLRFEPGYARGIEDQSFLNEYRVPNANALEHALYITNEQKLGSRLTLKYGLRFSMFNNIGDGTVYSFDENYNTTGVTRYKKGNIFNTYSNFEPRLGLNYTIRSNSSIKASYARTSQYMQLTQKSSGGMPLDVWFPASPNVKPQLSDQVAIGYFHNLKDNKVELSVETYYKKMKNTIDFKDFAKLLLNKELEGELRFGSSESYGVEFMSRFNFRSFQGWLGYTWSRSKRKVNGINNGKTYRSPYDKPHDIKAALSYSLSPRTTLSANFSYTTGAPITLPTGRAAYQGSFIKIYSDRNSYRMEDYHRLDLAVTIKGKEKPNRKWQGEWNISLYNAYGRKNPWYITFEQDDNNPNVMYAEKTYLFTYVPSITYNFKF